MKNLLLDFFVEEDIKYCVKYLIKPIVNIVYNELYPYLWFICIYNVFLIFVTLGIFIILSRK